MSIRHFLLSFSLLLPLTVPAQTSPGHGAAARLISLEETLRAAQDNLEATLARRGLAGAQADITSADRAPLPVLSASISQIDLQNGNGPGRILQDRSYDKSVGLDWTWERGNKRELRTQTAQRAADAARAELDETSVQQGLAALSGFYDLLAAQERVDEVTQIERNAAELARIAARRLQAGDLSAQETARTEIEAQRASADLGQAELERQRAALQLWQLTALAPAPELLQARADWPTLAEAPADLAEVPDEQIEARADVQAARARLQAAQAALDGASAQKKSDITWGVAYNHYPGTSNALLALRMQMPLQWGYGFEGEIGRASAQLAQAEALLERTRRLARLELQRLQQGLLGAARRAGSYEREILPRARRVAEGAELAYRRGALSLTDLLDARRTLRTTVLDAVAARADYAKSLGGWQLRTGRTPSAATRP